MSLAAVAVAAAGVVVRRPPRRSAWLLLVAGLAAFAMGDLVALMTSTRQGLGPADVGYLAAYPLLVAGLHHMRRRGDQALDTALARVDSGSYGVCESCGQDIAPERLAARPAATLCITCASRRR